MLEPILVGIESDVHRGHDLDFWLLTHGHVSFFLLLVAACLLAPRLADPGEQSAWRPYPPPPREPGKRPGAAGAERMFGGSCLGPGHHFPRIPELAPLLGPSRSIVLFSTHVCLVCFLLGLGARAQVGLMVAPLFVLLCCLLFWGPFVFHSGKQKDAFLPGPNSSQDPVP